MKTKIEQLRADMMTNGAFTGPERRQVRYLTKANEAQRQYVMASLPRNHLARGWMETCGEADDWGNIDYCGVPLCPRCHLRERGVQTGKAIKKIFCGAANDELAFATILLPAQLDLSGMTNLVETEKRRLRTFIDRQRKKDARWNEFQLLGWWEIDRMSFGDWETCGRNTQIALKGLGFPVMEALDKTIWRPHLHAIIHKGKLTTEEVASALRKETHTAQYQVDVQPFRANRGVEKNIQNIVRYCLKFRIENGYKRPDAQDFIDHEQSDEGKSAKRNWWPAADVREYVDWLCVQRSGFQSLRVLIGKARDKSDQHVQAIAASDLLSAEQVIGGYPLPKCVEDRQHSCDEIGQSWSDKKMTSADESPVIESNGVGSCDSSRVLDKLFGRRMSMYNNNIQDTNWTGVVFVGPLESSRRHVEKAVKERPGYVGNVISLSEHIRSLSVWKSANGAPLGRLTGQ